MNIPNTTDTQAGIDNLNARLDTVRKARAALREACGLAHDAGCSGRKFDAGTAAARALLDTRGEELLAKLRALRAKLT